MKKLSSSAVRLVEALSVVSSGLDGDDWLMSCLGLELAGGALKKLEKTSSAVLVMVGAKDPVVGESANQFHFKVLTNFKGRRKRVKLT